MSTSASAFSTSEQVALEKDTDSVEETNSFEEIWNENHLKICSGWLKQNGFKKICLQFPDDLLTHAVPIRDSLKNVLCRDAQVFILADTTYGSCCVDEVAAAHVEGDCIVHFGNACKSKVSRLPVLYMLPHLPFELDKCLEKLASINAETKDKTVAVFLDIGYHYLLDMDEEEAEAALQLNRIREVLGCNELSIDWFPLGEDAKPDSETTADRVCIFIGSDNSRFTNLSLTTKAAKWFIYDVKNSQITAVNPLTTKYIRKRYYYIEKCKDAKVLGLIVATLTTDGYLDIISHIQEMAKGHGIKTQIISVGRINPAKLANFLEIDCFVLIGCPFNNMYNDKDYYKPIVSVFEAEMALNPAWLMKYPDSYVTDFKELLPEGKSFLPFEADKIEKSDVSLVSGNIRNNEGCEVKENVDSLGLVEQDLTVAANPRMDLLTSNTGLTFEDRTWKGLDQALGQTDVAKLQKGLSGIPTKYTHD